MTDYRNGFIAGTFLMAMSALGFLAVFVVDGGPFWLGLVGAVMVWIAHLVWFLGVIFS